MKVYFSCQKNEDPNDLEMVKTLDGIDAIDIVTLKYIVRIRATGILVLDKETKDVVSDSDLDLRMNERVRKGVHSKPLGEPKDTV